MLSHPEDNIFLILGYPGFFHVSSPLNLSRGMEWLTHVAYMGTEEEYIQTCFIKCEGRRSTYKIRVHMGEIYKK
jgi:hypothetical protein